MEPVAGFRGDPVKLNVPPGELEAPVVRSNFTVESPTKMGDKLWSKSRVNGTTIPPVGLSNPAMPPKALVTVIVLLPMGVLIGPTVMGGKGPRSTVIRSAEKVGLSCKVFTNGPANLESAVRNVVLPVKLQVK